MEQQPAPPAPNPVWEETEVDNLVDLIDGLAAEIWERTRAGSWDLVIARAELTVLAAATAADRFDALHGLDDLALEQIRDARRQAIGVGRAVAATLTRAIVLSEEQWTREIMDWLGLVAVPASDRARQLSQLVALYDAQYRAAGLEPPPRVDVRAADLSAPPETGNRPEPGCA